MTSRRSTWRDTYKVHPAADVFPMMSDEEIDALAADIKANGLRHPVHFFQRNCSDDDGRLLIDGRNRMEALERIGFDGELPFKWTNADPVPLIISLNIRRRHLTKQQQADLIVAVVKADADAKAAAELREHQEEIVAAELLDDGADFAPGAPRTATHPSYQDCVNRHRFSRHVGEKRKKGRKADAVKAKAVVIAKEQGVSKRTVERSFAKAEGKIPELKRYAAKPLPKPRSGKPVVGLEAARRHYLDLCAEPGVDLDGEQEIIIDGLREIAGKLAMQAADDDLGDIPACLDRRRQP